MYTVQDYITEEWARCGVATAVVMLRAGVRLKVVGWRNLDGTDVWCSLGLAFYITVTACNYILTQRPPALSALQTPESVTDIPDEMIPGIVESSKISFFSWTMYVCMIFAYKGTLLSLFGKITTGISSQRRVVGLAVAFTILCFCVSVLIHLCACTPIQRNWQVRPWAGIHCTKRPLNFGVIGALNIATDLVIMIIPMPMLWSLNIDVRRKIALSFLLCSGIFIIICTFLRMYFVLHGTDDPLEPRLWSGRECFVSMIVVALPGIWPLLRKLKWLGTTLSGRRSENNGSMTGSRGWPNSRIGPKRSNAATDFEMYPRPKARDPGRPNSSGSEAYIMEQPKKYESTADNDKITVTTDYVVSYDDGKAESMRKQKDAALGRYNGQNL